MEELTGPYGMSHDVGEDTDDAKVGQLRDCALWEKHLRGPQRGLRPHGEPSPPVGSPMKSEPHRGHEGSAQGEGAGEDGDNVLVHQDCGNLA